MMLRSIFLAVLLPVTFVVGAVALYGGAALYRQARTLSYAATAGTVTHSALVTDRTSPGTQSADIRYTYEYGGQSFAGSVYRHGSMPAGEAQEAVRARPVGALTQVYVDPRNPTDAVLDAGLNGLDLLLPLFVTFACTALAFFWRAALGLFAAPLSEVFALKLPELAHCGVRTAMLGARLRVRLPYYHPFVGGGATLGIMAFATAFAAALASGSGKADLSLVLAAWALTIAVSVAVAVWLWRKERSGRADFVIYPTAQMVELPAIYGRKAREDFSTREISGVAIESQEHRQSRGSSYLVHSVVLRRKHGKAETVVAWRDSKCAEAF